MNDPIQALKDAGYHVVRDRPISKRLKAFMLHVQAMFEYGHFAFGDPLIIKLLNNAQLRKGTAMTADQLLQAVKPGNESQRFLAAATFIAPRIFYRGYTLTCPDCKMTDWYPLYDLDIARGGRGDYWFSCRNHGNSFILPINAQLEYKLTPLAQIIITEGGLTLLNVANHFVTKNVYYPLLAVEVKSRNLHTDIDLLFTSKKDGGYLVECKDNFQTTDEAVAGLQQTIGTGLMLADTLGYQYVFATLQDEVPLAIIEQLDAANARLLTASDLLKPYEG